MLTGKCVTENSDDTAAFYSQSLHQNAIRYFSVSTLGVSTLAKHLILACRENYATDDNRGLFSAGAEQNSVEDSRGNAAARCQTALCLEYWPMRVDLIVAAPSHSPSGDSIPF